MADPSGADRIWKMGSSGTVVKGLQAKLNQLLDYGKDGRPKTLATDGIFGTQTEAAVKEFQAEHKLKVDGIVGPITFDAMFPKPKWSPPKRHVVYLYTQGEVVNRALGCIGAPIHYHLEYPNGGTDPTAPMPCDEQTGGLDCSGFDAWVQGFDRDFLDGFSKTLDGYDGYCNVNSKLAEALNEGKVFSIVPWKDIKEGDMLVGFDRGRIGHEGTVTRINPLAKKPGITKEEFLCSLEVVHCSPSNVNKPGNTNHSAVWKTDGQLWGNFDIWHVVRFNREYAVKRYHELTGYNVA